MSFQNTKLYCYLIATPIKSRVAEPSCRTISTEFCFRASGRSSASFIRQGYFQTYARTSAAGARHRTITSCRCRHRQCIHHIRQRKSRHLGRRCFRQFRHAAFGCPFFFRSPEGLRFRYPRLAPDLEFRSKSSAADPTEFPYRRFTGSTNSK